MKRVCRFDKCCTASGGRNSPFADCTPKYRTSGVTNGEERRDTQRSPNTSLYRFQCSSPYFCTFFPILAPKGERNLSASRFKFIRSISWSGFMKDSRAFSKKGQRFFRKPAENTGKYLKTSTTCCSPPLNYR